MKSIAILLLSIFFSLVSCKYKRFHESVIGGNVLSIVHELEKNDHVATSAWGEGGKPPDQYELFLQLNHLATTKELLELLNYKNGVVRVYSFWALASKKNVDIFPILFEHWKDEAEIQTWSGDIGNQEKVGDYMIALVTPDYIESNLTKLNTWQRAKLDSILFHTNNDLRSTYLAYENAGLNEHNYKRLRKLVTNYNNPIALVALAKYRKEKDILLIKRFINEKYEEHVFRAITNYPHPEFWKPIMKYSDNILKEDHFSNSWKSLYKAAAIYKNDSAILLLQKPFTESNPRIRNFLLDFVYEAITEVKDPIYDKLLFKLWLEENIITYHQLNYLLERDFDKSMKQIWISLDSLNNEKNVLEGCVGIDLMEKYDTVDCGHLIKQMLDVAYKQDRQRTITIINGNLLNKECDFGFFESITEKVAELKPHECVESLFKRLEIEENPHLNLNLINTLLHYKQERINKIILKRFNKNKMQRFYWWQAEYDEILKEHKLLSSVPKSS